MGEAKGPEGLSQTELAWAAGFFDGEGTVIKTKNSYRPQSVHVRLSVPQKGMECLERFRRAVGGYGYIYARACTIDLYAVARLEHVDIVLNLLWPYLSTPKRNQALRTDFVPGVYRIAVQGRPFGSKDSKPRRKKAA
jgi:hypothetical protein